MAFPNHYRGSNRPDLTRRAAVLRAFHTEPLGTKVSALAAAVGCTPCMAWNVLARAGVQSILASPEERTLIAAHRSRLLLPALDA